MKCIYKSALSDHFNMKGAGIMMLFKSYSYYLMFNVVVDDDEIANRYKYAARASNIKIFSIFLLLLLFSFELKRF